MMMSEFDIAIIGAGITGLVCAQQLTQAGYSVVVLDKSRGVGGRVATRRLQNAHADHGTCYLKPQGEIMTQFIDLLCQQQVLQVWQGKFLEHSDLNSLPSTSSSSPRYVSPTGINAVAKVLAQNLDIRRNQLVTAITPTSTNQWSLTTDTSNAAITAKSVVVAIPAPQAFALLAPLGEPILSSSFLNQLESVEYNPCISIMAKYSLESSQSWVQQAPSWNAVTFTNDEILGWMGWDSSKSNNSLSIPPVLVIQSSAQFANLHLETSELQAVGQQMLQQAHRYLGDRYATPDEIQVHRWRYAFVKNPLPETVLAATTTIPLVCCGDWCGGSLVPGAISSGIAAAEYCNRQLQNLTVSSDDFLKAIRNNFS